MQMNIDWYDLYYTAYGIIIVSTVQAVENHHIHRALYLSLCNNPVKFDLFTKKLSFSSILANRASLENEYIMDLVADDF